MEFIERLIDNYPFLGVDFLFIVVSIILFVILNNESLIGRNNARIIRYSVIYLACLLVFDRVEFYLGKLETFTYVEVWCRNILSGLCYSMRPALSLLLLSLLIKKKKILFYISLPAMLNATIAILSIWTGWIYSINIETNIWSGGPIWIINLIVGFFYLFLILVYSLLSFKDKNYEEGALVFIIVIANIVGFLIDSESDGNILQYITEITGITFYYVYFQLQTLKRDPLTRLLNRQSFYADIDTFKGKISAVISIDMNNLKLINDENGHDAGDEALREVSRCFRESQYANSRVYRIGGDEFVILCFNMPKEKVEQLVKTIRLTISETPYVCALGYVFSEDDKSVDELLSEADKLMYSNKKFLKEQM